MENRTYSTKQTLGLCSLFLIFLLVACCNDQLVYIKNSTLPTDATVHLTASRMQVVTRDGDADILFHPGTFYRLFAAKTPESDATYAWNDGLLVNSLGVETESHEILYELKDTKDTEGTTVRYPGGEGVSLDFYGITLGTKADPMETLYPVNNEATHYKVAYNKDADSIPDILYSTNLKGITVENAGDAMKFKHSLSSVKFKISRQEQESSKIEDGTSKDLGKVTLEKIEVIEPKSEGTLDILTGTWSYEETTETLTRTFYNRGEKGKKIEVPEETNGEYAEIPREIDGEKESSDAMSIFPNEAAVKVRITLSLEDNTTVTEDYTINAGTYDRDKDEMTYSPFRFEANYQYTLTILLLESGMRVIAIIPAKYEWVDYDISTIDAYLGQPVTFNGLMWMDRNLGAKTADCENDFYGSIGYYYQMGRNIPFILDTEKFKHFIHDNDKTDFNENIYFMTNDVESQKLAETLDESETIVLPNNSLEIIGNDDEKYCPFFQYKTEYEDGKLSNEDKARLVDEQLRSIYTFDHKGDTVYGIRQETYKSAQTNTKVIRYPGDVITDEDGNTDDELTHEYYKFSCVRAKSDNKCSVWTNFDGAETGKKDMNGKNLWSESVDNQPCPKGWRLPTKEDASDFMPSTMLTWTKTWPNSTEPSTESEQYYYGRVTPKSGTTYNVVYLMKNYNTNQVYRIRIQACFCTGTTNKRYIRISRYTAEKGRNLASYLNLEKNNKDVDNQNSADWANPVESIEFPCAGFIVTDYRMKTKNTPVFPDMRCFGKGSVLRTSETTDGDNNSCYGIYIATQSLYVQIANNTRRSLGDQVRCVRDISTTSNE